MNLLVIVGGGKKINLPEHDIKLSSGKRVSSTQIGKGKKECYCIEVYQWAAVYSLG